MTLDRDLWQPTLDPRSALKKTPYGLTSVWTAGMVFRFQFDPENKWFKKHINLVKSCRELAGNDFCVDMPDPDGEY